MTILFRNQNQQPRNNNNLRNDNTLNRFGYVLMMYGLMTIFFVLHKAWQKEQKNLGTCPAPRF